MRFNVIPLLLNRIAIGSCRFAIHIAGAERVAEELAAFVGEHAFKIN